MKINHHYHSFTNKDNKQIKDKNKIPMRKDPGKKIPVDEVDYHAPIKEPNPEKDNVTMQF